MEYSLSLLGGFVSGALYNEHIYKESRLFPKKRFLYTFKVRFLALAVLMTLVAFWLGAGGLLAFAISHLFGRFAHLILRTFKRL